jgi:hypothetical protein
MVPLFYERNVAKYEKASLNIANVERVKYKGNKWDIYIPLQEESTPLTVVYIPITSPAIPMVHNGFPILRAQFTAASSNGSIISWANDPQSRAY